MLTKKRIPLFIAIIFCIEILNYNWSVWTSTFVSNNFFAIEPAFIFDKCARIAARFSTIIVLVILLMVGYYGLKKIFADEKKKETFLILITLFTVNHLIHLFFVFCRFKSHDKPLEINGLSIGSTFHGFITFIFIVTIPIILWFSKKLTKQLYWAIIFHLLNVSLFINKTFLSEVKPPEYPSYHRQLGIAVITAACIYILYRVYIEYRQEKLPK